MEVYSLYGDIGCFSDIAFYCLFFLLFAQYPNCK